MDVQVAPLRQGRLHPLTLVVTVLQQQPSLGLEVLERRLGNAADVGHATIGTDQGTPGFMAQFGQMGVAWGNVGRVGDDQLKACGPQSLKPIAFLKGQRQPQTLRIVLSQCQCAWAAVHSPDFHTRGMGLQSQGDGPTATPQVHHTQSLILGIAYGR